MRLLQNAGNMLKLHETHGKLRNRGVVLIAFKGDDVPPWTFDSPSPQEVDSHMMRARTNLAKRCKLTRCWVISPDQVLLVMFLIAIFLQELASL